MMPTGMNPAWSLLMLILVVALIPAGAWLARRLPGLRVGTTQTLAILETLNIGPRERLLVIRAGTQTLLVGATGHSISLLSTLPDYDARAASPNTTQPFSNLLEDVRHGKRPT